MKKRLLITSTLMAAVLACALGTGTYAWYEATKGSTTLATAGTASVQTQDASALANQNLSFNVEKGEI